MTILSISVSGRLLHRTCNAEDYTRSLTSILRDEGIELDTRCGEQDRCSGCTIRLQDGYLRTRHNATDIHKNPNRINACTLTVHPEHNAHILVPESSLLTKRVHACSAFDKTLLQAGTPLTPDHQYGVAVDIGTTTIAVAIVDTHNSTVRKTATCLNSQSAWGDNVLTRINYCATDPSFIQLLQELVIDDISTLLGHLLKLCSLTYEDMGCCVISANTTMLHIIAGVDPTSLGTAPFTASFLSSTWLNTLHLSQESSTSIPVLLLPSSSAYVGSDICSGAYVLDMNNATTTTLLIDVGTNGEMILASNGTLRGCATAAGPAFEGAGLISGSRAQPGAITHMRLNEQTGEIQTDIIGPGTNAKGICGTAYLDFLAEGIRTGLLNTAGRFTVDTPLAKHCLPSEEGYQLFSCDDSQNTAISEADISNLLQAKAAIAAGVDMLLDSAGISMDAIDTIYLAGGFGLHINTENAVRCGLIPNADPSRITAVGNTSLAGACQALINSDSLHTMETNALKLEIVELNGSDDFEDHYIDHLMLEH